MYVDMAGNLRDANGNIVSSMQEVKTATDGTRQGIININGTPYEITVNKEGTISALNEIKTAADEAAKDRDIYLTVHANTKYIVDQMDKLTGFNSYNYNGLDNVPYDGYRAVLHKGERVLTAEENKAYSSDPGIVMEKWKNACRSAVRELTLSIGSREFGRMIDNRLRERGSCHEYILFESSE